MPEVVLRIGLAGGAQIHILVDVELRKDRVSWMCREEGITGFWTVFIYISDQGYGRFEDRRDSGTTCIEFVLVSRFDRREAGGRGGHVLYVAVF
jgi:hypothetical protein